MLAFLRFRGIVSACGTEVFANETNRLGFDGLLITEAGKPSHTGVSTEPRELPFGILPSPLLNGLARRGELDFAAELATQFPIADKLKRLGGFG